MWDGTAGRERERGLSEVVGFILLLGVLVAAMALWMMYIVPANGRENEIQHMNAVKDRFTDYKISLDSLWINSNNPAATATTGASPWTLSGVTLSTSFNLGPGGSNTQVGGMFLPMMEPLASSAVLSLRGDDPDLMIISSSGGTTSMDNTYSIKKIAYTSQNYYWIQQRYYYQTGGVFLAQDDGITCRIAPPISVVNSSRDAASAADFTSSVTIAPISLDGGAIIGGNGPVRVDSRLKNIRAALGPEERYWVRITVQVEDYLTAQMWDTTFKDIMNSGGIPLEWYETGTSGPGVSPATAYAYIKGPYDDTTHADVWLKLHPAEYAITFNNIASGIT